MQRLSNNACEVVAHFNLSDAVRQAVGLVSGLDDEAMTSFSCARFSRGLRLCHFFFKNSLSAISVWQIWILRNRGVPCCHAAG